LCSTTVENIKCNEDDEYNITELQQEQETTEQLKRKLTSQQKCRNYEKKVDPVILFIKEMQIMLSQVQDRVAQFLKVRMH